MEAAQPRFSVSPRVPRVVSGMLVEGRVEWACMPMVAGRRRPDSTQLTHSVSACFVSFEAVMKDLTAGSIRSEASEFGRSSVWMSL